MSGLDLDSIETATHPARCHSNCSPRCKFGGPSCDCGADKLNEQTDQLVAAVRAVLEIHRPYQSWSVRTQSVLNFCLVCGELAGEWPCATVRAVGAQR